MNVSDSELVETLLVDQGFQKVDNPDKSGTRFIDMEYSGPTKKHTGVFMLNNYNTRHGIVNPGPGNRLIGYQMLHIDSICK